MTDLTTLTLADARDGLKAKRFSSAELTRAHVGAIEKARALNAFVLETPQRALEMAQASDARLAKGEAGALEGLPLGIKDLFCTRVLKPPPARRTSSRASSRNMNPPSRSSCGAKAP